MTIFVIRILRIFNERNYNWLIKDFVVRLCLRYGISDGLSDGLSGGLSYGLSCDSG